MERRQARRVRTLIAKARSALEQAERLIEEESPAPARKLSSGKPGAGPEPAPPQATWDAVRSDIAAPTKRKKAADALLKWTKPALVTLVVKNNLPVDTRASKAEIVNQLLQLVRVGESIRGNSA